VRRRDLDSYWTTREPNWVGKTVSPFVLPADPHVELR
jgi:hypothetical protein